jgi:membrane protein DedA with SNARE-associated domain
MLDLHSLISTGSYVAIFILMLTNGAVNFPSSQFLYVICGYFISTGSLLFIPTVIAGTLGNTLGNIITFLLVKKYDKPFARKLLMVDEATFTKIHGALHATFSKRGLLYIFVGKLIPSVKAFIPIVAGLANTKTNITSFIFFTASAIWAIMITSIGYFFGEHASFKSITSVSLLIGAIVIFFVYKTYTKQAEKIVVT